MKGLGKHFKDVRNELRKVHWPNRRELTVFTTVVLAAVFFVGVFFFFLDYGFGSMLHFIVR